MNESIQVETKAQNRRGGTQHNGRHSPALICGWLMLAVSLLAASFAGLSLIYAGGTWPDFRAEPDGLRQVGLVSVSLATVLAGSIAIAMAMRRQQSAEQAHELDRDRHQLDRNQDDRDRVSALRERFTKASEQLGHESATIRIAGAYALAALADDWLQRASSHPDKDAQESARRETQVCVDLLCSYIRTPRKEPITDSNASPTPSQAAESEVRTTIISIISDHLQAEKDRKSPRLEREHI